MKFENLLMCICTIITFWVRAKTESESKSLTVKKTNEIELWTLENLIHNDSSVKLKAISVRKVKMRIISVRKEEQLK